MTRFRLLALAGALGGVQLAHGQSMNIDFHYGQQGTLPSSSYAAAGLAGVWSPVLVPGAATQGLVDLSGSATAATFTLPASFFVWTSAGPWTGDDRGLFEDYFNGGGLAKLSGLLAGTYDVYLYTVGVFDGSFTINGVTKSAVGGAWTGHQEGVTYVKYSGIAMSGGDLDISFDHQFSGMQLVHTPQSVPEPFTMSLGVLGAGVYVRRRLQKRSA